MPHLRLALRVLLLVLTTPLLSAVSPRVEKTINGDWTFQYHPAEEPDLSFIAPGYNDAAWPAVALPHTWSTYETTGDQHLFIRSAAEKDDSYWWYGWGCYRKHLTIGNEHAGRRIAFEFDGVQKFSRVYVNGQLVGEHKGGYTSFSYDNFLVRALNEKLGKPAADKVKAAQDRAEAKVRAKAEKAKIDKTNP